MPDPSLPEPSLRERRRAETTQQIADAAVDLALENGWNAVTVDEIAARAGISRRTFFNYFATKDEALFHNTMAWRPELLQEFHDSPLPLADALEALFERQVESETHDRDRALQLMGLVETSPELLPGLLVRMAAVEDALARAIAARGADEFTARTVAAVAGAVLRVSGSTWLSGLQPDLLTSTRAAWAALRTLTDHRSDV
ncbi:TetR/AcrR family transcriptional regulator [Kineococcus sp. SYSU DK002]|uniref:TetR/AcrR family transcriptional regulator n=1 Tax=Kineococcus sp. SYSU DK002 TaxID=3383123 RepID=UPI003D7EBE10